MSDVHYLSKVLGLSAVPRIITSGMTVLTLPIMLRAVGAGAYGQIVYIESAIAVLASFIDLGIPSAAGKEIATLRDDKEFSRKVVITKWARLQALVALLSILPLLAITYVISSASNTTNVSTNILVMSACSAWFGIASNFARAALASLLSFKVLAVLDTFQSLLRNASWLAVAYAIPSALGLALANLVTAGSVAFLSAGLLWKSIGVADSERLSEGNVLPRTRALSNIKCMLLESFDFLWLRLATTSFQALPNIVFGYIFGAEMVGVVAAFSRVVELINFPFIVIGNALAVRVPTLMADGNVAVIALWDAISRFFSIILMFSATIYFGADILAHLLLPESKNAGRVIAMLSVTVITYGVSALIAPMSDYVGALKQRNIILTTCTLIQAPIIWLGSKHFGVTGGVAAYIFVLLLMNAGYVYIALKIFFPAHTYRMRPEFTYFLCIAFSGMLISILLEALPVSNRLFEIQLYNVSLWPIAMFWSTVILGLRLHSGAKSFFLSRNFLTFTT